MIVQKARGPPPLARGPGRFPRSVVCRLLLRGMSREFLGAAGAAPVPATGQGLLTCADGQPRAKPAGSPGSGSGRPAEGELREGTRAERSRPPRRGRRPWSPRPARRTCETQARSTRKRLRRDLCRRGELAGYVVRRLGRDRVASGAGDHDPEPVAARDVHVVRRRQGRPQRGLAEDRRAPTEHAEDVHGRMLGRQRALERRQRRPASLTRPPAARGCIRMPAAIEASTRARSPLSEVEAHRLNRSAARRSRATGSGRGSAAGSAG